MSRRQLVTIVSLLAFASGFALAGGDPEPKSGSMAYNRQVTPEVTILTVPRGMKFVLTDLRWSSNTSPATVRGDLFVKEDSVIRWQTSFRTDWPSGYPVRETWSTGLVFTENTDVNIEVIGVDAWTFCSLSWSGYLVRNDAM